MKYIITIKKEDGPSNGNENRKGITPEDTFHMYDKGGMFCSCCSKNETHEYIFEEPEEVVRWFVHRYCESINEAADRVNEIRKGESCNACHNPDKHSYNPRQLDK